MTKESNREGFSSKLGAILALAGSAVGLGNIWRFPYMVSEYGGAAFIVVYILCIAIVALPIMLCEFSVGRRSRASAFNAVAVLGGGKHWNWIGYLVVFIPFITLCYYSVIGGWTLEYFFGSCMFRLESTHSPNEIGDFFEHFVSNPWKPVITHAVFLFITTAIIMLGVQKGIEKSSKIMMPQLFVIMLAIAVWVAFLPGASDGLKFIFKPEFGKITPQVTLAAMGQAFYTLSIGSGILITYASYFKRDDSLIKTAGSTIIADLVFAIIAACAIIPALFPYGMETSQGTGLVFKALPVTFSRMPAGNIVSAIFFFGVLLAAITSEMALFEVPVSFLMDHKGYSRKKACHIVFIIGLIIGSICSLSFGPLSFITIGDKNIFDITDYTIGNILLPFSGLAIVLFVGWKMKHSDLYEEINNGGENVEASRKISFRILYFTIRYISPAAIIAIFLSGIFQ